MTQFPNLLTQLHQLQWDTDKGMDIDFEPYQAFISKEDTTQWLRQWAGNDHVNADLLLVFGQDGTGGYAAFWLIHPNKEILDQPIVFFGSEGQTGLVAKDFNDYLWLLSQNHGPCEAIEYPEDTSTINSDFLNFAQQHSKSLMRSVTTIIDDAQKTYPHFISWVEHMIM